MMVRLQALSKNNCLLAVTGNRTDPTYPYMDPHTEPGRYGEQGDDLCRRQPVGSWRLASEVRVAVDLSCFFGTIPVGYR